MTASMKFCVLVCTKGETKSQAEIGSGVSTRFCSLWGLFITDSPCFLVPEPQELTCYSCVCANPCICGNVPFLQSLQRAAVATQQLFSHPSVSVFWHRLRLRALHPLSWGYGVVVGGVNINFYCFLVRIYLSVLVSADMCCLGVQCLSLQRSVCQY